MKINILIDKNSWANKYKQEILFNCKKIFKNTIISNSAKKIRKNSYVTAFFSYFNIVNHHNLIKSKFNIVLHESNVPKGRGMSPITWSILNNQKNITFSLIKASKQVDAGNIYFQKKVLLKTDLIFVEIKSIQFKENMKLLLKYLKYIKKYSKEPRSFKQKGVASYFKLRKPKHSKVNLNKSIKSQFNLLRVSDYNNYPCYFYFKNKKYYLKLDNEKTYNHYKKNLGQK